MGNEYLVLTPKRKPLPQKPKKPPEPVRSYWSTIPYATTDNYDSGNCTAVGETIELRSGKVGTIRFIGPVHFAKGNWIGVEFHDHFGQHDGSVRGVRYFTCPQKRGIFVKEIKGE